MPIEFRCSQCGALLRTGDETAGKQAKCPTCGLIQPIPLASQPAAPPPTPPPGPPTGSPFGVQAPVPPQPATGEVNPYQSPIYQHLPDAAPFAPGGALAIRPTRIDLADVLSRTWRFATTQTNKFFLCLAVVAIAVVVQSAEQAAAELLLFAAQLTRSAAIVVATNVAVIVVNIVFQTWIQIGQTLYIVKTARGDLPPISLVFSGGPWLLRMILAYLLLLLILLGRF